MHGKKTSRAVKIREKENRNEKGLRVWGEERAAGAVWDPWVIRGERERKREKTSTSRQ